MAAQGGILFQEKVSRLLNRQNGKPVLKPNKPLALRDVVANRKLKKGEATCITEMSILMACWKQSSFVDGLCSDEIKSFYTCVEKAQLGQREQRTKLWNAPKTPVWNIHRLLRRINLNKQAPRDDVCTQNKPRPC